MSRAVSALDVEERSLMLGRYSIECRPQGDKCPQTFNSISIFYGDDRFKGLVGSLSSKYGLIASKNTTFDFVDLENKEKGYYFCIELPANRYSFFDIRYSNQGTMYYLDEDGYFDLPVNLFAGEATYIGNLKATTTNTKNIFGLRASAPGILVLDEPNDRDISKALAKCPSYARGRKLNVVPLTAEMAKNHPMIHNENN